jgi:hypothetical protein
MTFGCYWWIVEDTRCTACRRPDLCVELLLKAFVSSFCWSCLCLVHRNGLFWHISELLCIDVNSMFIWWSWPIYMSANTALYDLWCVACWHYVYMMILTILYECQHYFVWLLMRGVLSFDQFEILTQTIYFYDPVIYFVRPLC